MICEIEEDITPIFQPSRKLGQHQDKENGASVITTTSRSVLGPTQPPIQWVPGDLSVGVKLTTHLLNLVPRSRTRRFKPPLPQHAFMAGCSVKKLKANGGTGTSTISKLYQNRFQLHYFPVAIHFILQSLIIAAFDTETLKK
jgi:hypothetical protein